MKIGELEILPVWDGQMIMPEPQGFPAHDSPEFEPHSSYVTDKAEFKLDLGGFLVRTAGRVVLIDAGLGDNGNEGRHILGESEGLLRSALEFWRSLGLSDDELEAQAAGLRRQSVINGSLPDSLRSYGVSPADVTDVVVSHLHPDHIGWVSANGTPFFSNATVWCHQADTDHFLTGDGQHEQAFSALLGTLGTRARMAPVSERIELWSTDREIAPGISVRHLPGHTPGNAIIVVSSGAERAYILGDTFHCAYEVLDSSFAMEGDVDAELARQSKATVVREIEDGDIPVAAPHFPDLRFGRVVVAEGKRGWVWDAQ